MSSEDIKQAKIEKLKEAQQARKEDAKNRVHEAIERLEKINAKINFHVIAREAQVSVSYLYKYPDIKQRIAQIRSKQSSLPVKPLSKPNSTALRKVVTRLQERIKRLEDENKELKRKNEALAGQAYRVHHIQEQIDRLQQENERLRGKIKEHSIEEKVTPINRKNPTFSENTSVIKQNNLAISANIEEELQTLGITLNATLTKTIQLAEEERVLLAIEALKEQLAQSKISNVGGWLNKAIQEGWTKPEQVNVTSTKPEHQVVNKSEQPQKKLLSTDKLKALSNLFKNKNIDE